jgi:membrane protein
MVIKGYRVGTLLKKTGREILDDRVSGLAAQAAYYFFFSLFPLLLFVAPLLTLIGDPLEIRSFLLAQLAVAVPADAYAVLRQVVDDVVFAPNAPGLVSLGAVLALWSGSNIFGQLMEALNRAYDVKEDRPWWKRQLLRIGGVIVAGIVVTVATAVMLAGENIVRTVGGWVGLGDWSVTLWTVLQFPLALSFLVAVAWGIFYFLPNAKQDGKKVLVGATVTTVLWIVVTLGFRLYVQNFGSYNKTYGAIGGVIVMLTWMYLTMLVVLAGGELTAELHCGTAQVEGERGRVYAGRIATGTRGAPSSARVERVASEANK